MCNLLNTWTTTKWDQALLKYPIWENVDWVSTRMQFWLNQHEISIDSIEPYSDLERCIALVTIQKKFKKNSNNESTPAFDSFYHSLLHAFPRPLLLVIFR